MPSGFMNDLASETPQAIHRGTIHIQKRFTDSRNGDGFIDA
jgi:hypothetical protein